jgi:hypothetical protein
MQRVDDPITPEVNSRRSRHAFVLIGVTQDIQPMPRVTDRMLLIGQQLIDDLFIGVGRIV